MKIITVNLPLPMLKAIDKLININSNQKNGCYSSRSELLRTALRDFFLREINDALTDKAFQEQKKACLEHVIDETMFVRVPINSDPIQYKTYKLVKK